MFNLLTKLVFWLKRPSVVLVAGENRFCVAEAIFQTLRPFFRVAKPSKITPGNIFKKQVLVLTLTENPSKALAFFIKKSRKPILVVTHIGEVPFDVDFFAGEPEEAAQAGKLASCLDVEDSLILNFDDETVREIGKESPARSLTFGFQKMADLRATDVHINEIATNFKVNYQGNIVPVWLKGLFGKEQVYAALAAIGVGTRFNLNLVELSQALKNYQSLPGKMRMIEGINNSRILDDSENSSPFSMVEALEVLKKIKTEGRRIAVLGDILGIGRYSVEAHETIGEKVAGSADLLFALGPRAKFLAQGAKRQGLSEEKVFPFDVHKELLERLQKEIKNGDLVLVDGSREIKMSEIVEGIGVI